MFDFDRKVKTTGNYFVSIHPSQMFRYFNPMESTCQEHRSNKSVYVLSFGVMTKKNQKGDKAVYVYVICMYKSTYKK